MSSSSVHAWCEAAELALANAARGMPPVATIDAGPSNDVEVARLVRLLETTLTCKRNWSRDGGPVEDADWLLSEVLATLRRGDREQVQTRGAELVALLSPYADSVDDVLTTLAWLDTEASLRELVAEISGSFQRRERAGFGAILDEVPRDTRHRAVLFPALVAPIERAMTRQLCWDSWHLDALEGVAKLANDLDVAAFSSCDDELRRILAGGDRVSATVSKSLRLELEKAVQASVERSGARARAGEGAAARRTASSSD